jgi:predicted  nucleic acid-binding Zn-ribbon protein
MNADPGAQLRLLDLQAADTAIAQLAHRRATLAEVSAIAVAAAKAADVNVDVIDTQTRRDDLAADQRRLENEVEAVRTRADRDETRLTAGGLPAKELEGLQHEITSLARRQSSLEDELLEIMEQREAVDAELAELVGRRTALEAERGELESRRDDQFADIDDATGIRRAERTAVAAGLPAELLALYEKVAAANGGVGAAALHHRRCEGCRLELAGNELTALRAATPDAVVRCENCRRILVRTAESGL